VNSAIEVQSARSIDVINVTSRLAGLVRDIDDGLALFYAPHTTVVLLVSEDDDALRRDLARVASSLLAPLRPFEHVRNDKPNAEAHIISALGGTSLVIPVTRGELDLGTYQNILLIELDGPRNREIHCKKISRAKSGAGRDEG
jgi:secondary thiamine-phosphate synthase enzyme